MKICIIAGGRTEEICTYLQTNYRCGAELSVWFPKEKRSLADTDMVISENEHSPLISQILAAEEPPLIVVFGSGVSTKKIRYIKDFPKDFPAIMESLPEKEPTVSLVLSKETYVYPQRDVVSVVSDKFLHITLCSGKSVVLRHGFRRLWESLSPGYFFRVGDKALVNILYVSQFRPDGILLENGNLIPCTEEQLKRAENAYYKTKFLKNSPKKLSKS